MYQTIDERTPEQDIFWENTGVYVWTLTDVPYIKEFIYIVKSLHVEGEHIPYSVEELIERFG